MQSISSLANGVSKAVWGEPKAAEEPKSGETGAGTATQPYDAGNAEAQSKSETTPVTSASTTTAPATTAPTASEEKIASTLDAERPGNARTPSFALNSPASGVIAEPKPYLAQEDQLSASGRPNAEPSSDKIVKDDTDPNKVLGENNADKNAAYEATNVFDAAKDKPSSPDSRLLRAERTRSKSPERSVSPGARPDGSHAETGKAEKTKLSSKIKEKLHIGSKH